MAKTLGGEAIAATARQYPFVAVGVGVVAGMTLARLFGRRSIVRPMLVAPLLSRLVAPIVMRMVSDAALRMVRGAPDRDKFRSGGGRPHPP